MQTEQMRIDGEKLKAARLERFLDGQELAERAGLSPRSVTRLESGDWPGGSRPSTIRRLAEVLGVDPHDLLEES